MTKWAFVVLVVIGIGAGVLASAQTRDTESAISRELVNEVRALRGVIERYAEGQIQTQAITSLMDVQQRRLAEVNGRLDTVRRELAGTTVRVQELTQQLGTLEQASPDSAFPPSMPEADRRRELEVQCTRTRNELESISAQLQQLHSRESELLNQLTMEEGKWNELVGRLDQWLRK
jgi:predicted  nucleic acid-binding Zn-ribbon protein